MLYQRIALTDKWIWMMGASRITITLLPMIDGCNEKDGIVLFTGFAPHYYYYYYYYIILFQDCLIAIV